MTDDSKKAAKEISDYVTHALMAFGEGTGCRFDAVEAALAFTNLLGNTLRQFPPDQRRQRLAWVIDNIRRIVDLPPHS